VCCSVCRREYRIDISRILHTLQHTATHCNTLQHTATHTYVAYPTHALSMHSMYTSSWHTHVSRILHTLQHTATHTLQHTATHKHVAYHTHAERARERRTECVRATHTHTAREREYVIKIDTAKQGVGFEDIGHV